MKKITLIIVLFAFEFLKAQNPVVSLDNRAYNEPLNTYFIDDNHKMEPFVGTWLYTNGNTSLEIQFYKETSVRCGGFYEDLLIGEYRYVVNGVEKFNTLNNLNNFNLPCGAHGIHGNFITSNRYSVLEPKIPDDTIYKLHFRDNQGGMIQLRKTTVNGQEAIQIFRKWSDMRMELLEGDIIPQPLGPTGEFFLIKQ